jgi:hypothetical protein
MKNLIIGVCVAYLCDVTLREWYVAKKARALADQMGRPMLNVGSGSGMSSATGPKLRGDINCDLAASRSTPCGPETVCFCDASDLSMFSDRQFGVALAANVLRYVPDRQRALDEIHRVADVVIFTDNLLPWPQIGAGSSMVLHGDLT